ncbi:MAG: hypothetical protein ACHQ2E_11400 [Gemmatimonadales bacterium]
MTSRTRITLAALGGIALALAGVQGCSSPVATPTGTTDTIYATASLDGWVTKGGQAVTAGQGPYAGQLSPASADTSISSRQFYSFDISIPITAHLLGARLELYQANVVGDPYAALGNLMLDHVAYGGALTASAYTLSALNPSITFSTNANYVVKTAIITSWVQNDIDNGRNRTQVRLRFVSEFGPIPINETTQFSDAELSCCGGAGVPPRLIVSWQ